MGIGPAAPVSVGSVGQLSLSLVLVGGLIFAVAWVLKRFRIAGPRSRGGIAAAERKEAALHEGKPDRRRHRAGHRR